MTIRVHTNDLPEWAIHERQLPHSYLNFLSEPIHEAPDGKGPVSLEEQYFRRQYEAGLKGNRKALSWLLKRTSESIRLSPGRCSPISATSNCGEVCFGRLTPPTGSLQRSEVERLARYKPGPMLVRELILIQ